VTFVISPMQETDIQQKVDEIVSDGFCILRGQFPRDAMQACFDAFLPTLLEFAEANRNEPNRGSERHYINLPFEPPFYDPRFFFDETILAIGRKLLSDDLYIYLHATDTPLNGSVYQDVHEDLGPLFHDHPDLVLPPEVLTVNYSFVDVTPENGPFEVARGSHRLPKSEALVKVEAGEIPLEPVLLEAGDVLVRNPRCLHRGTPNTTDTPRPVAMYTLNRLWRHWNIRGNPIPDSTWDGLTEAQQRLLKRLR